MGSQTPDTINDPESMTFTMEKHLTGSRQTFENNLLDLLHHDERAGVTHLFSSISANLREVDLDSLVIAISGICRDE